MCNTGNVIDLSSLFTGLRLFICNTFNSFLVPGALTKLIGNLVAPQNCQICLKIKEFELFAGPTALTHGTLN